MTVQFSDKLKAAAEPSEKEEELKRKAHKKKSSERHYLEPQMKTIRKYAVLHSNKQPVQKFSGEIIGYAMSEATVRKLMREVEKQEGKDIDSFTIPVRKRGRPLLLHETVDELVK